MRIYLCVWYDSIPKDGTQANRPIGTLFHLFFIYVGYSEAVLCQHWKQVKVLNAIELYNG